MLRISSLLSPLVVVTAVALAGCAAPAYQTFPAAYPGAAPGGYPANAGYYSPYGRVANVEFVRDNSPSVGVGTVAGGALGGVVGNRFGGGSGRAAATIAGVIGGALIGHALEQNANSGGRGYYRVTVQMESGGMRSFDYAEPPNVQVGERVRVDGNQLYR